MTNEQSPIAGREALSAETAFVVHLTADRLTPTESLRGRAEHVKSGQSLRFASVTDLVSFMQRVLATTLHARGEETA